MKKLGLISRYIKILISHYIGRPFFQPDMVAIVVSARCNLKCKMCSFWSNSYEFKEVLMLEDYDKLFTELRKIGVNKVQFTGGEPLLRQDFFDILEMAKKYCLQTIIVTNATLINEDNVKILQKNADKIFISLDAPTREIHDNLRGIAGTFDKVKNSLYLLNSIKIKNQGKGPVVTITSIITPYNIHDPEEMLRFLKNLGVNSMIYNPASSADGYATLRDNFSVDNNVMVKYDRMIDAIIKLMDDSAMDIKSNPFYLESSKQFLRHNKEFYNFPCYSGGYDGPHIDIDGNVYPCCAWTVPVGNITEKSFDIIWKSEEAKRIRKIIKLRQCPMCYHHTRTFDYVLRAPFLIKSPRKLLQGYKKLLSKSRWE